MNKDIENTDHIERIQSEIDDDYSNDDLYNINSWGADLSFRELITMYQENELIKPELQRKYVWDKSEASRFIESILLGLPVPSIFLAKTKDEKNLIVDGYQRIMTVHDYVTGIFSKDEKIFKLSNTKKINEKWRNKAFKELGDNDQRKIRNTTIHAIIFEQIHPNTGDTSLYQVFERINTSGRTLMPQEIRNCVYQGPLNTLLFKLNKNHDWRILFGDDSEDNRMRDIEMILRFYALADKEIKNKKQGQISLKKYLNEFMGDNASKNENVLKKREVNFVNTIEFIKKNFGPDAFRNISSDGKTTNKFHPTIFDAISIATNQFLDKNHKSNLKDLQKKRLDLLKNKEFIAAITTRTTNIENINKRINLACEILYGISYK